MKTHVISTRYTSGLYNIIISEAEKLNLSASEVTRIALRSYFDNSQRQDQLSALEKRIIEQIDAQSQRLMVMMQKIIFMAQA